MLTSSTEHPATRMPRMTTMPRRSWISSKTRTRSASSAGWRQCSGHHVAVLLPSTYHQQRTAFSRSQKAPLLSAYPSGGLRAFADAAVSGEVAPIAVIRPSRSDRRLGPYDRDHPLISSSIHSAESPLLGSTPRVLASYYLSTIARPSAEPIWW
jgi:hypothetical protein